MTYSTMLTSVCRLVLLGSCLFLSSFSLTLDERGLFNVDWQIDSEETSVTFLVTVQTTGFVGFGLSPTGSMWEADIVIGGVHNNNGTAYFNDYHGVGQTRPQLDKSQDYNLLESSQNETHTQLKFSRLLQTGDVNDVQINDNGTNFIWSFGQTDRILYHGPNRGTVPINLFAACRIWRF